MESVKQRLKVQMYAEVKKSQVMRLEGKEDLYRSLHVIIYFHMQYIHTSDIHTVLIYICICI